MKTNCITCGKELLTSADAKAHTEQTGHSLRSAAHKRKLKAKSGVLYRAADRALMRATTGDKAYRYILAGYRPTTPYWAVRKQVLVYRVDDKVCTCRQWYATTGIKRPGVDSKLEKATGDKRELRGHLEREWETRTRGEAYAGPIQRWLSGMSNSHSLKNVH